MYGEVDDDDEDDELDEDDGRPTPLAEREKKAFIRGRGIRGSGREITFEDHESGGSEATQATDRGIAQKSGSCAYGQPAKLFYGLEKHKKEIQVQLR